MDKILDIAGRGGARAIHPGCGFLSENAGFARACEEAGRVFISSPSSVLRQAGHKLHVRKLASSIGLT